MFKLEIEKIDPNKLFDEALDYATFQNFMVQMALDINGDMDTSKLITTEVDDGLGICTVYNISICENGADDTPLLASIWFGIIAMM